MQINVKKMNKYAKMPIFGTECSAGADLYGTNMKSIVVEPHSVVSIGTGLCFEIPEGFVGLIYARSGVAIKRNLALANSVGVIDSDYRGEVKIALYNYSDVDQIIYPRERLAQMIVTPYPTVEFIESENISETARGFGGFGSTGKY